MALQTCPVCPDGDPDPECEACAGKGTWQLRRCPFVFTDATDRKVVGCADMVEIGVLPAAGGWQDQTAWFQQAASVALGEKHATEERKRNEAR